MQKLKCEECGSTTEVFYCIPIETAVDISLADGVKETARVLCEPCLESEVCP